MGSTLSNQIDKTWPEDLTGIFFSVSFSHHYLISSKSQNLDEALFYLNKVATEFWNYRHLEKQIEGNYTPNKAHFLTISATPCQVAI